MMMARRADYFRLSYASLAALAPVLRVCVCVNDDCFPFFAFPRLLINLGTGSSGDAAATAA